MGIDLVGPGNRRRGHVRVAAFAVAVLATLFAAGCGDSGEGAVTNPEKGADAEILNASLARELTLLDAYTRGRDLLAPRLQPLGRQLRAQEQEYVNALTKALRGLGGDVEVEPEEVDLDAVEDQADLLALLYGLEGAALAAYLDAARRLNTDAPRTLDASLAAGHAQHLVVLRQALGASAVDSIPEAFDSGEIPPPAAPEPRRPGGAHRQAGAQPQGGG